MPPAFSRRWLTVGVLSLTALGLTGTGAVAKPPSPKPWAVGHLADVGRKHAQKVTSTQGPHTFAAGEDEGDEAENAAESADQYNEARTSPGVVAPGAYGAAFAQMQSLPHVGRDWNDVTALPYDSDDTRYRDVNSNSSGGAGKVTGRITGVAA